MFKYSSRYSKYKKYIQGILYTFIVFTLVLSSIPFVKPVHAATETRIVAADGPLTDGTYGGIGGCDTGTFANLNLNDACSWVYMRGWDGVNQYRNYDMQDTAISGTISNVRLYLWAEADNSPTMYPMVTISGTDYLGSGVVVATGGFAEHTYDWAKNPATGLDWTASTINSAYWGWKGYLAAGNKNLYVDYMYIEITYSSATAPTVTTSTTNNITYSGSRCWADFNGEVTATGGSAVTIRGFAWGTTCNSTTPDSTQPPDSTSYTANWSEYSADHGTGTFSYTTNLTCCTTFCVRAYAFNGVGWAWGAEDTFVTMCDPDIDTQAATYVEATTARLNALVIYDGEQACDVRFCYGTLATANCTNDAVCDTITCNCTTYNSTTPWVLDTYTTGQTPYVDLSGLLSGTQYYFCSQIRNDMSCACGGNMTFTTETGVGEPGNFKGIARLREISLFWVKGVGSSNTLVRAKTGSYPSSTADGVEVYNDTLNSVVYDELTPGTTYFFRAWGESGGVYSSDNVTLMITTLGDSPIPDTMPIPTTADTWYDMPDSTRMSNMPFYDLVNWWAESFEIPASTLWFMTAIFVAIAAGVFVYWKSQKVILACLCVIIVVGLSSFMGLLPMWLVVPFVIIMVVSIVLGERP